VHRLDRKLALCNTRSEANKSVEESQLQVAEKDTRRMILYSVCKFYYVVKHAYNNHFMQYVAGDDKLSIAALHRLLVKRRTSLGYRQAGIQLPVNFDLIYLVPTMAENFDIVSMNRLLLDRVRRVIVMHHS